MIIFQFAKPIEQLLAASPDAHHAMIDTVDYMNFANELRADILDRFPYPSLWAAIDKLVEFEKKQAKAENEMHKNGYIYDDAFTLHSFCKGGDSQ